MNTNFSKREIMTAQRADYFLDMSMSCLYKLTSKGIIPFYKPGGKKIYFLKDDLISWITGGSNSINPLNQKK